MQHTITVRRISYNWIAIMALLVVVATLVGFVVGRYVSMPSASTSANAATTQVQAQTDQRLLQLNEELYPSNAANAPTLLQRNQGLYDLNERFYPSAAVQPKGYAALKEAQLAQEDARIGTATFTVQVPTIDGCNLVRNEPDC